VGIPIPAPNRVPDVVGAVEYPSFMALSRSSMPSAVIHDADDDPVLVDETVNVPFPPAVDNHVGLRFVCGHAHPPDDFGV